MQPVDLSLDLRERDYLSTIRGILEYQLYLSVRVTRLSTSTRVFREIIVRSSTTQLAQTISRVFWHANSSERHVSTCSHISRSDRTYRGIRYSAVFVTISAIGRLKEKMVGCRAEFHASHFSSSNWCQLLLKGLRCITGVLPAQI